MTRQEFAKSLTEVNEAVCKTTQISSQCAYLVLILYLYLYYGTLAVSLDRYEVL